MRSPHRSLSTRPSPGQSYILAGTVLAGSVRHQGSTLLFRVRDPKLKMSVPVRYTGIVPDPFAEGRGVLVTVKEQGASAASTFVGEQNSLTTKCPVQVPGSELVLLMCRPELRWR